MTLHWTGAQSAAGLEDVRNWLDSVTGVAPEAILWDGTEDFVFDQTELVSANVPNFTSPDAGAAANHLLRNVTIANWTTADITVGRVQASPTNAAPAYTPLGVITFRGNTTAHPHVTGLGSMTTCFIVVESGTHAHQAGSQSGIIKVAMTTLQAGFNGTYEAASGSTGLEVFCSSCVIVAGQHLNNGGPINLWGDGNSYAKTGQVAGLGVINVYGDANLIDTTSTFKNGLVLLKKKVRLYDAASGTLTDFRLLPLDNRRVPC